MHGTVKMKEGFDGQKAIVVPRAVLQGFCRNHPLIRNLFITDIGFYPKATHHHRHRPQGAAQHILLYCHQGGGMATVGGKQYRVQAGDFIIIPCNTPHTYAADKEEAWTIYWVHFTGSASGEMVATMLQQHVGFKGSLANSDRTVALFNEMYLQLERGYHTDNLVYSNLLLGHFFALFLYNDKQMVHIDTVKKDIVDRAIDFLKENVHQSLSLSEIAAAVNLSISHFSALFKQRSGFAPVDYFNQLKMQQACRYLLFTDLRIKEIAQLLGIEDTYYFSRLFSKIMGKSPTEYRTRRIH